MQDLRKFFPDLQDKDYESAIAMVHSRYSPNTNPRWQRAHPNRMIVHNGEINTIRGNADKMLAREETMKSEHLKGDLDKVTPVVNTEGSDSAMLDNTLEFLTMSGMDLPLAVMITLPAPWANSDTISQEHRGFYQYYAPMMAPWDGPTAVVFSDGVNAGAVLDRNGLRPARYSLTTDDLFILASDWGGADIPAEKVGRRGRLRPGEMIYCDLVNHRRVSDAESKIEMARRMPYRRWVEKNKISVVKYRETAVGSEYYFGE